MGEGEAGGVVRGHVALTEEAAGGGGAELGGPRPTCPPPVCRWVWSVTAAAADDHGGQGLTGKTSW